MLTAIEERGPLTGSAISVVDLDSPLAALAIGRPWVTVGIARRTAAAHPSLDIALCEETDPPAPFVGCPAGVTEGLARIEAAVERAPLAAVTLAQVLRVGEHLDRDGALVVESLAYAALQSGPEHARWLATRRLHEHRESPSTPVRVKRTGTRLEITLDRPNVLNAVDVHVRDSLVDALAVAIADQSVTEIELRGAGPAFCAGGDLGEFGTTPDPVTGHIVRTTRSVAALLAACRDRLVVHVHGVCFGAGIEMAAFARRVVAAPDTRFSLPELAFGLIPGAGGTVSIPRRIGRERTAYLALTGEEIDAATALSWGLVDEVTADVSPATGRSGSIVRCSTQPRTTPAP